MLKLFDALNKLLGGKRERSSDAKGSRRRGSDSVGRWSNKEIEQAPPEKVGELVGHAPERVET
jgi:hypothetical protein